LDAGIRGRPTRMQIFRSWAGGHPSAMILGFGHILQRSADIVWGLRSRDMSFCPESVLFVMIGYQYICPAGSHSCHFKAGEKFRGVSLLSTPTFQDSDDFYRDQDLEDDSPPRAPSKFNFTERDLDRHVEFNIKGDDVIVFLHIQKTGGTLFGRHLVRNIRLEQPCDCKQGQKKCTCHRPGKEESWLFSRFSTGWSCGLHADWTELTNCVPVIMDKKEAQRN
ncbi:unnamed protein product, partial [Tetraodon nigroviridis]